MGTGDQRGQGALGGPVVRVRGRVEPAEDRTLLALPVEFARRGDHLRRHRVLGGRPDLAELTGHRVEQEQARPPIGEAEQDQGVTGGSGGDRVHGGGLGGNRGDLAGRDLQHAELGHPVIGPPAQQPVGVQHGVRLLAQDPLGIAELALPGAQVRTGVRCVDAPQVQVPPVAAIGGEHQSARGEPARLDRRLARSAGHRDRGAQRQGLQVEVGDQHPGGLPRHVRVVPLDPRQPGPAGLRVVVQFRSADEVGSLAEHRAVGRAAAGQRQGDQGVAGLGEVGVVFLADGQQQVEVGVQAEVGVPEAGAVAGRRRGQRAGAAVRVAAVQPVSVAVVGEHHDPAVRGVRATAVLVHRTAYVGLGRGDLLRLGPGFSTPQAGPARIGGGVLQPVEGGAVHARFDQAHRLCGHQIDGDLGLPGAVRSGAHGAPP